MMLGIRERRAGRIKMGDRRNFETTMNTSCAPQRLLSFVHTIRLRNWLWLGVLLLFASGSALAETKNGPLPKPEAGATKEKTACPSRDFTPFFRAFSTRTDLQRRYTLLPLEYGFVDIDSDPLDIVFKTKVISKFEEIPQYRTENGAIFPTAAEMKAGKLKVDIITNLSAKRGKDAVPEQIITSPNNATAALYLPDAGFWVLYRFKRTAACWFLFGISDRST